MRGGMPSAKGTYTERPQAESGLGIGPTPPSANESPQETTMQEVADKGLDGASLPCPGSSVVANKD
jgi:hypothetical protein